MNKMTDRELLELAAKAAGMDDWVTTMNLQFNTWNPLENDGDAFRLMVELGLQVTPYPIANPVKHSVIVTKKKPIDLLNCPKAEPPFRYCEDCNGSVDCAKPIEVEIVEVFENNENKYAATRRAIVRAAAQIGKEMMG